MSWEYNQYLAHHGIKGQKWGVRRYQNEDGTLTAEGMQRYRKEHPEVERILKLKPWLKDVQDKNGHLTKLNNYYNNPDAIEENKKYKRETEQKVKEYDTLFSSLEAGPIANAIAEKLKGLSAAEKRSIYDQITGETTYIPRDRSITRQSVKDLYKDLDPEEIQAAKKIIQNERNLDKPISKIEKNAQIKMDIPDYDKKTEKLIKSKYSEKEIKQSVKDLQRMFVQMGVSKSTFESFSDKPSDEQLYYMLAIAYNMGLM